MKFKHKIAFIIPTRNRPDFLVKLLQSLQKQTVGADQVIIVDGSDQPIESGIKQFLSSRVSYLRIFPPSLTKQRNEGIKVLNDNITLVGYLDDDLVLETDAVEAMLRFWEQCSDEIGGTSFNITNNPIKKANLFTKLFCINNGKQGAILRSGYTTILSPVLKDTYTEWLCGGATVWRREVVEEFKYDEWFEGLGACDDADFSIVVAQKYKLIVQYAARVQHFPPPLNSKRCYSLGKIGVISRHHFVRKHAQLSIPLFFWATLGEILGNTLYGVWKHRLCNIILASGNIAGLTEVISISIKSTNKNFRK